MENKTQKDRIETEVEKTLACFDKIERLENDPHFSTRLLARIRDLDSRTKTLFKPVSLYQRLRPALLVVLVAINIIFSALMFSYGRAQTDERKNALSAMASYYDVQKSDLDSFISYE